jgi:hypothetical protein
VAGEAEREQLLTLRVEEAGYARCTWVPGTEVTGQMAREAMQLLDELNEGRKRPLLVDMRGMGGLTRGARQAFADETTASRLALLGRSPVDRVIANFTLRVISLQMPVRYFTSEPAALAWLTGDQLRY